MGSERRVHDYDLAILFSIFPITYLTLSSILKFTFTNLGFSKILYYPIKLPIKYSEVFRKSEMLIPNMTSIFRFESCVRRFYKYVVKLYHTITKFLERSEYKWRKHAKQTKIMQESYKFLNQSGGIGPRQKEHISAI